MCRHRILGMVILFVLLFSQSVPRAMAAGCDSAQFVSDLSIPDGSSVAPGAAFTKTWRLLNNGTCTWGPSYNLVWAGTHGIAPSPHQVIGWSPGACAVIQQAPGFGKGCSRRNR